jgi:serine/threonine protein kinase
VTLAAGREVRGENGCWGLGGDIWSLGALLFQMLTGRVLPMDKAGRPDTIMIADPGRLCGAAAGCSACVTWCHLDACAVFENHPELWELIQAALRVDPATRPTINQILNHPWLMGRDAVASGWDGLGLEGASSHLLCRLEQW